MAMSQRNAGTYILRRKPFRCGNVFAAMDQGLYVVYSYGTHWPMAVHAPELGGWLINHDNYSSSTSRQVSRCGIRSLPGALSRGTRDLLEVIRNGSPEVRLAREIAAVKNRLMEGAPA